MPKYRTMPKRMDPAALAAMDAAAARAKETAKSRRAGLARIRLWDGLREQRLKDEQGPAYVPPGMRTPCAANSKRRLALGKTPAELQAIERHRAHYTQPTERRESRDFSDIEAVRARHRAEYESREN